LDLGIRARGDKERGDRETVKVRFSYFNSIVGIFFLSNL